MLMRKCLLAMLILMLVILMLILMLLNLNTGYADTDADLCTLCCSVVSCTPVSSRMISIRISAKPHNVTIIQVYAPSTDHDDEEVEEFYELLENHIKTVPKKDILMIQLL